MSRSVVRVPLNEAVPEFIFRRFCVDQERRYQLIERKRTRWFIINKHAGYSKHNTQCNSPGERRKVEKELRRRRRRRKKKWVLICPLVDERSPCGWRELSKAAKWIIICELDWRQTLNEDDVNLADMRGLRESDWQRERWQQANTLGSEKMNGTHIIIAMKLLYSTGRSKPPL